MKNAPTAPTAPTSAAYHARVTALAVVLTRENCLFAETTTHVRLEDEAAGEFVVVEQSGDDGLGKIHIDPTEWPVLRQAINRMVDECQADVP